MSNQLDLAQRVTDLEQQVRQLPAPVGSGGRLVRLGAWLLAALLTVNVCVIWKMLDMLAKNRVERHFWTVCHEGATDDQRCEAFSQLVKAGNTEWRSARLAYLDLRRGDFDGVQLAGAEMKGCDFTQSTMVGANLKGADLRMAKLADVDLSYVNLSEAYLLKADLSDSTVRNAYMPSVSLEQCDLENTDFEASDMTEANLLLAVLKGANLRNAILTWGNLDAADLRGANLEGANLENVTLFDADFADSNWWRAVGLASHTIERLKTSCAPSPNAPGDRQKDYQQWLEQQSASPPPP